MRSLVVQTALACLVFGTAASGASSVGSFLVTNNDATQSIIPPDAFTGNTATFYSIGPNGAVSDRTVISTGGLGVGGGSFSFSRIAIVPQSTDVCVFMSNANNPNIAAISGANRKLIATYLASPTDSGLANGVGLAANANYLYATFSTSSTIATFSIQPGCSLSFVSDTFAVGLNGGVVGGMAVRGTTLVMTYGDGSIESFNISSGVPVSNGDAQNSTGSAVDHLPNGVDITADGHYAIFGDASPVTTVEVSDISSGKLTPTVAYDLGSSWNSGNLRLSPDESLIFVTNNSGGEITAALFDKTSGKISPGCASAPLSGFYTNWGYAGAAAMQLPTTHGGLLYVPEFGLNGFSSIGIVQLTSSGTACTLTEVPGSPIVDNTDPSFMLSIGTYPVRPF